MIYGGAPFSASFNPHELFYYYDNFLSFLSFFLYDNYDQFKIDLSVTVYLGLQHGCKKVATRNAAV